MKNIKFILAVSLAFAISQSLYTQELGSLKFYDKTSVSSKVDANLISASDFSGLKIDAQGKYDFMRNYESDLMSDTLPQNNISKNVSSGKKERSPVLGALMSAVLPGSGEFYGGNILKAAIFLGVEIIGWGTYAYLQHKGDTKTAAFEAYADQNWSIHKYAAWLKDQGFASSGQINPNEQNWQTLEGEIHVCESDPTNNFSHTLPDQDSQQFYELIGKYQTFQAGWTNLAHDPTKSPGPYNFETYRDPVFVNYAYSRQDANNFYDYANDGIYFVVLNHILSAADAAWTVSTFNKKLHMETGFRINRFTSPYTLKSESMPTLYMTVDF